MTNETPSPKTVKIRRIFGVRTDWLGLDSRSVAMFRIALGLLILVDLILRWASFSALYGVNGIVPPELWNNDTTPQFSLFLWARSNLLTHALFALFAVAAVLLMLGWRSRTMAFLCWLLLVSLNARNPLILNTGDLLFTLLLFWAWLLPLGAHWSLDARRTPQTIHGAVTGRVFQSPAALGLHLQVVLLYVSASTFKLVEPSWRSGTHMYNTFSRADYARPLGVWIGSELDFLLPLMTWCVPAFQLVGGLLLLASWRWGQLRCALLLGFLCLQVSMALTLYVGLFSLISIIATIPLLPPWFWEQTAKLRKRLQPSSKRNVDAPEELPGIQVLPVAEKLRYGFAAVMLCILVITNVNDHSSALSQDNPLMVAQRQLHFHQRWRMFNHPAHYSQWYVVAAQLKDGRKVDLLRNGAPVDLRAATHLAPPDTLWFRRRTIINRHLVHNQFAEYRPGFLRYMREKWDREQKDSGSRVVSLELIAMRYTIQPNHTHDGPKPVILAQWPNHRT